MRKIVKNKVYDTDTATLVGKWSASQRGYYPNDFAYYEEELYRKKTGEYFLRGEGNAASPYAKSLGERSWGCGEAIKPLSYAQAQAWAEEKLSADEYEKIFGTIEEDDSRQMIHISIAASTVELAKRKAAALGKSLSAYVEGLIAADNA